MSGSPRVLLVTGSFPPMKCGVGDYTERLAAALANEGAAVGVLTDAAAAAYGSAQAEGVEVLPLVRGWRFAGARRLLDSISAWRPDVVHFQFPTQGYGRKWLPWILPLLVARRRMRIVQTWHEYQNYFMPRYIPNALLGGGLVVVRPRYKETMFGWFRRLIAHKQFAFIPNASSLPVVALGEGERDTIRARYGADGRRLILYFGFAYPAKGIDLLFEMLDPARHRLVVASDLRADDEYHRRILEAASSSRWRDSAHLAGFLPAEELARAIAAADAVVLPFRTGGGSWNTSLHAVVAQGTPLVTTSTERSGYDEAMNVFFAAPDDVAAMREAIERYAGRRVAPRGDLASEWGTIAREHLALYSRVMS